MDADSSSARNLLEFPFITSPFLRISFAHLLRIPSDFFRQLGGACPRQWCLPASNLVFEDTFFLRKDKQTSAFSAKEFLHWSSFSDAWRQKSRCPILLRTSFHEYICFYRKRFTNLSSRFPDSQIFTAAAPSHAFRTMAFLQLTLPAYSDRIAQDFHLIPFYLRGFFFKSVPHWKVPYFIRYWL